MTEEWLGFYCSLAVKAPMPKAQHPRRERAKRETRVGVASLGFGTVEPKSREIYGNLKENLAQQPDFVPEKRG